jgi:transcriptional regulator of acetoin/glycerol metabolism
VAALCQKILNELSPHHALTIAPSLMRAFLRYSWPGNLRQLNNVLKTAAIMAVGSHEISTEHLADDFIEDLALLMPDAGEKLRTSGLFESTLATPDSNQWGDLKAPAISTASDNLEQVEIATIRRVLDACGGNVSTASKQLNISRNTIYRKLKKQA